MRLVSFRADVGSRIGVMRNGDEVVEIDEPGDMLSLIDAGESGLAAARSALSSSRAKAHRLGSVELLSPIPEPRGNIIAIGRNYQKHAAETAAIEGREPSPPTIFTKAITSLTEPFADIAIDPAVSDNIDWEVELGVIIGKKGANIKRDRARPYVFGYTVVNDVTARDIQSGWGGQYFKGKSLDRSSPMGPWIVTADEIPDPQSLRLQLHVGGVQKQDGNTNDMIYTVDAVIEWVSIGMTILPGTIIATGTPDGVGFARKPPEFLKPGDVMETEVENVGKLRNRIVAADGD
ncbi:MAG TPA: fumarylacetoacetate hydrolase family protein [Candidatus Dormibacteraeota bacterium]|nr:fumarylacetoacetate hydrolase family protein [Candidatus Dormibacteraeota bacterium]